MIVRTRYPLIFGVSIDYAREIGWQVTHRPPGDPPADVLPDCAHLSAEYPASASTKPQKRAIRSRLIEQMTLLHGDVTLVPDQ